jgi:hypothetical protein
MNKDRPIDVVILALVVIGLAGIGYLNYQTYESNKYIRTKVDATYDEAYGASAAAQQAVRDIGQISN